MPQGVIFTAGKNQGRFLHIQPSSTGKEENHMTEEKNNATTETHSQEIATTETDSQETPTSSPIARLASTINKQVSTINEKVIRKAVDTVKKNIEEQHQKNKARFERTQKSIDDKINVGLNKIKDRMNLPRKEDIEKLTGIMENLDNKLDALAKKM
jgi:hypothetical protein